MARDVLKYGHQTALNTLKAFPEAEWNRPGACGVWSVKDIIAHLASYEHMLVEVLGGFLEDGPTPTLEKMGAGLEQFNADEVSARRDRSMAEVLAELNDVHTQTITLAGSFSSKKYCQVRQPMVS